MRRFPWSQLKDQPDKLFLIQPTQSNMQSQALLIWKAAEGWQAEREVKQQFALPSCLVLNAEQGLKLLNLAVIFLSKVMGLPFSSSQKCQWSQRLRIALVHTSCTQSSDCFYEGINYSFAKMPQIFQKEHFVKTFFTKKKTNPQPSALESSSRYTPFFHLFGLFSYAKNRALGLCLALS